MRKHIFLATGIAVITALTIGTATSRGQAENVKAKGKRAGSAAQTPADLKVRPRTGAVSPAPIQRPAVTVSEAAAEPTAAPAINLDWVSINHGGATEVASGDLRMGVSVAQNVAGFVTGGPYQMGLGFWYGAAAATGGACVCDCAADPMCDGITDILDVVRLADVAFRGGPPYIDPSPTCPYENTDVNCDGITSILDAVRMADVAFRGGDPLTLFCDPCTP